MSIYDVPTDKLLQKTAEELKKIEAVVPPVWAGFVKTGVFKERPPVQKDWWYLRAASVLRKIMILGPIGVSKLRNLYGGRKNRGVKPERFFKGSGNIIRKILQQLEKAELIKQAEKSKYKGRIITPKGSALLGRISSELMKNEDITFAKKVKIEPEKKTKKKKAVKKKRVSRKKKAESEKKPKKKVSRKKPVKKEEATPEEEKSPEKVEEKKSEE
ncbi:30S ribosomal protein S19e [Candidatus Woesearchaeota archaeon]|nr:MAG: 30S ribosomal protein S19e [Candidatus Woesearchaeota archaeon ex4484_78]RLE45805.1 MAG: 30S ribosomal protein S19e [Candidatus Woesearchaeota archaeon]